MTTPLSRDQVPRAHQWNLQALFASDEAWEQEFAASAACAEEIAARAGTLVRSADSLADALRLLFSHQRTFERLYVYASHRRDEDLTVSRYQDMTLRITSRLAEYEAATAFVRPEILAIPPETMEVWRNGPELAPYAVWLGYLLRYRAHTLSQPEERIIAMAKEPLGGFVRAFGMLNDTERPRRLPTVADEHGSRVQLTNARLARFLESTDGRVRSEAFTGFYTELSGNVDTLAVLLDSAVRAHVFEARARNHPSALHAALFDDQVTVAVYGALIEAVHESQHCMHDYFELKRDVLKVEALRICDVMAPVVQSSSRTYTYDEAQGIVLEALAPLGDSYVGELRKGFANGWVDRFENQGKRSGAYSGGCYDSFPYILHNFNGTLNSVFTLAHEAGHSMHSLLSRRAQPYHMAHYSILVAEVASITNEMLLFRHLMGRATGPEERAALLNHLLTDFRSTLFRQTMFAEFERGIHEHVENGGSLTSAYLSEAYLALVRAYHGAAFRFDEADRMIRFEWARIPHLYYNFYVYKYATGMAAAADISSRILSSEAARAGYLEMLAGGSSRPPLELLKVAGIDLESGRPVTAALAQVSRLLGELRELLVE